MFFFNFAKNNTEVLVFNVLCTAFGFLTKKCKVAGKVAFLGFCKQLIIIWLYISTLTQLLPLSYVSPMSMVREGIKKGEAP